MKRVILLKVAFMVATILMSVTLLPAQISNFYAFSSETETYASISGTTVPTAIGDNVISNPIDIGFTFAYGSNSYNQIKISSNGYITLGTQPGSDSYNALGSTTCPVVAPLWDDTYLQGSAQYLLSGTAPNRVFTVQFTGVKWPTNSVTSFSYQVRLHEDRTIEFIYGPGVGMPLNASASIGINMLPGGYNNFCSVTPGTPGSASYTVENSSISIWPGTNTKYIFSSPDQFADDLAAVSISGNRTPTAGVSYDYTVSVMNSGTNPQNSYTVSIVSGDTELASVTGPEVAPLSTVNVTVPWTPTTPGAMDIAGKVVLTGDENTSNDVSDALNVIVQPEGVTALTIGDGSQLARKPIDVSYRNSMFETIFPGSEITANGTFTGVSFYNDFVDTSTNVQTKIWLGTTTQSSLASGWIPAYQLVQVFDGYVTYPAGQNTINITFNTSTPFTYSGGNLVMLVNRPMDTDYYSVNNKFLCQTTGTNRSRVAYSDLNAYDPNNMGTVGTASGQFPKTTFYLEAASNDPVFGVDPQSHNFGRVIINQSAVQEFSVYNSGGGLLNVSSIETDGSPHFSVQNAPTLPISLGSGQSATFTVQYLPTATGNHSGTINITDDLARTTHTVALSGNCVDPTITAIPYVQNFDTATTPNLPLGWQKITAGSGTVSTVSNTFFSSPNSVLLNNSNSALGPFLISPPLSTTLQINTLKVRFLAKGASAFSLNVGIMSNPLDATSYTEVQNIALSSDWTAYEVDLRSYSGTGNYIAFKHSQGGNNRNIYLDNIRIEELLQDDLAALSIEGNTTPNVGAINNYYIDIFNWGLDEQDDYQVKLFKQGEIELASIPGPPIAGNSQVTVAIPWEPTQIENTSLYAKVVLANDQDLSNNQTQNLNVSAQASETTFVLVGEGDEFASTAPVNMGQLSSLYENIYTQDELNHAGLITILEFYNFFSHNVMNSPTKIWLGMTTESDLAEGWIPSNQLSLVFDGNVDYPSGSNTISIVLQEPYTLAPGYNLVMMVHRPLDTQSYSTWESFLSQTHPTNRSRVAGGSAEIDPQNPPTGTFIASYPQTGFYITPGTAGNLQGMVWNAEDQPLANATVRIQNGPHATTNANGEYAFQNILASDYAVTVSAHGYSDMTQYVTVESEETAQLDFTLSPRLTVTVTGTIVGSDDTNEGLAAATITITGYEDYQAVSNDAGFFTIAGVYAEETYEYEAQAEGYQLRTGTIEVGSADTQVEDIVLDENTYLPRNVTATPVNDHSDVEIIWMAPNPDDAGRGLEGYKVWRLEQGQEDDESAWISLTTDLITALRFTDTQWDTLPDGTFKWAVKSVYTTGLISGAAISNGLRTTGTLNGFVYDQDMQVLQGAVLVAGTHSATSQADGSYTLHLPSGIYNVACSLEGYYNNTQNEIEIEVGETTSLNFTLTPVSTTGTLLGLVKNNLLQPVEGATITVDTYQTTTVSDGSYFLNLPPGTYSVSCSHEDYFNETVEDVVIVLDQSTELNFSILPVANEDNLEVVATQLNGNYPNPFNPTTTISYAIKEPANVSIDIYNIKGQMIRSLVNEAKTTGQHTVVWDGKDRQGKTVGNGVYQYVLKAGTHKETRRMTLTK